MNLPLLLCRPSVEIPFQASRGEDFRKKSSSYWESFEAFMSEDNDGIKQEISVLKRDVKAPPTRTARVNKKL